MLLLHIFFEIRRLEYGGIKFEFFEDSFGFLRSQQYIYNFVVQKNLSELLSEGIVFGLAKSF